MDTDRLTRRAVGIGAFIGVMALAAGEMVAHVVFVLHGVDDGGMVADMFKLTLGSVLTLMGTVGTYLFGSHDHTT
jgi:hypothetical protein